MALHTLTPSRATLHGQFNRDLPPILTIDPGDTVRLATLDAGWNIAPRPDPLAPTDKFLPRQTPRDQGHALIGPIAIRGAEPGMALAVTINEVRPAGWGWTIGGGVRNRVNERLGVADGASATFLWSLDRETMTGRNQHGHVIPLRPFLGVMGLAPAEPGWHSSYPPRWCGGNLDCKELVAGSTLFLPIAVSGALFSVGDGHAAQGDGEVSLTAIECPMESVSLTFDLAPTLQIAMPRAHTPNGWVTMGLHEDLHEAAMLALDSMLDIIGATRGIDRTAALALASVTVDLRVTQIVNQGVLGVHAVWSPDSVWLDAPSAQMS